MNQIDFYDNIMVELEQQKHYRTVREKQERIIMEERIEELIAKVDKYRRATIYELTLMATYLERIEEDPDLTLDEKVLELKRMAAEMKDLYVASTQI